MSRPRKVTYVEDAENDSGSSIEGISSTRKYASHDTHRSPSRERSSAGKYRGRDRSLPDTDDESITGSSLIDSDSTARSPQRHNPRTRDSRHSSREKHGPSQRELDREQRERESRRREARRQKEDEERRRARTEAAEAKEREARAARRTRPQAPKHAATQPVIQQGPYRRGQFDDPAAYGVQQPAVSGSRHRPQARPASYYSGQSSGPPMANMPWQGQPPSSPFSVASFPPPHHMFPGGPGPMPPQVPPPPPSQMGPPGYFDGFMPPPPLPPPHPAGEPLRSRFDRRPSSAMGYQPPSTVGYYPEQLEYEEEYPQPRSKGRPPRSKRPEEGRRKAPPSDLPKRTQSARQTAAPFKPPMQRSRSRERQRPVAPTRRSVGFLNHGTGFDDADMARDVDSYHEVSPEQRRASLSRARRNSMAYDHHGMDLVPANSQARRSSVYGFGGTEAGGGAGPDNDKYFDALRYQEDVSGGPSMPLTAESLRKASKRGEASSSRSTRSTGSHDESDYRRSNTTGITRSSSGANNAKNEDLTIKVSRSATIRVPGAEIECNDGGEITVSGRAQPSGAASRAGSDKESTVYQPDDARSSRMDQKALTHRPRALSQVDTRSRADLRSQADTRSRADLRSRAGSQTRADSFSRADTYSRAETQSRADARSRADFSRSEYARSEFGRGGFERDDFDRADYTPRSEFNARSDYNSRADGHSRYAPSHYEADPFEPQTYDHAPYDPALAASNFY